MLYFWNELCTFFLVLYGFSLDWNLIECNVVQKMYIDFKFIQWIWNEMKLKDQQEMALKYFFFISSANANVLWIFAFTVKMIWWCHWDWCCLEPLNIQRISLIFWIPSNVHQELRHSIHYDVQLVLYIPRYTFILLWFCLIKLQFHRCFALMRKIPVYYVRMENKKSYFHIV